MPSLGEEHFESLMLSKGVDPARTDFDQWAFELWWETWFPEILLEYRKGGCGLDLWVWS